MGSVLQLLLRFKMLIVGYQCLCVLNHADDKVTVLESEKRAWESSPDAQAIRDALNPWRKNDTETRENTQLH